MSVIRCFLVFAGAVFLSLVLALVVWMIDQIQAAPPMPDWMEEEERRRDDEH